MEQAQRPAEIKAVQLVGGTTVRLSFSDGTELVKDLAPLMKGPVFEPLHDPATFALVRVDEELGTIVWPNGADLDPDVLRYGLDPCPAENGPDAWKRLALELSAEPFSRQSGRYVEQVQAAILAAQKVGRRDSFSSILPSLLPRLRGGVVGEIAVAKGRVTTRTVAVSMKVYTHGRGVRMVDHDAKAGLKGRAPGV